MYVCNVTLLLPTHRHKKSLSKNLIIFSLSNSSLIFNGCHWDMRVLHVVQYVFFELTRPKMGEKETCHKSNFFFISTLTLPIHMHTRKRRRKSAQRLKSGACKYIPWDMCAFRRLNFGLHTMMIRSIFLTGQKHACRV